MKLSEKLLRKRSYTWGVACFLIYFLFFSAPVSIVTAGPEGAQVVNGQVTIQQSGNNTAITASDKAIINYSSFDIAQPETVQFIQPGSTASVLNRILSANPTNINGTLLANGRVFFVNPAGVYIGNGARINVNQLVASGLNISNADFINGSYNFAGGNGAVINNGDISAQRVYLIGKQVTNSGNISCPAGYVVMAAGDRVFIAELGSDIVLDVEGTSLSESANAAVPEVGVLNKGTIEAAGGIIALAAAGDIYSQAISNVGSLSTSVETGDAGQIKLSSAGGEVVNTGIIEASGGEGGLVAMEGARVGQFGTIHADGITGDGGNVALTASDVVALSSQSLTTANAGLNGNGGNVKVFSPDTALFWPDAAIEAKGGAISGDGGFVEVSGRQKVYISGWVDAGAANGAAGTFLIDPTDITIQDAAGDITDDVDGTFTSTANTNTISDDTIEGYLNAGTSVTLDTSEGDGLGGGGGGAWEGNGDIAQNADATINKTGGGPATLTLIAERDIILNGGIVSGNDTLGVVLTATTGSVDLNAAVNTNGGTFTSTGVNFDNTNGTITTAGGNLTVTHTGAVTIGGALSTGSGTVDIDTGSTLALNAGISTSSGSVLFDSTGVTTVAADGDISAGGAVTFGADKAGTLTTSGDIITTDDNVTFTRAVTLGGNVDIDTTGTAAGNILFSSTIATGGNDLALDAGPAGNITLTNALTGGGDVTVRDGAVQSYPAMTVNSLDIQDATTSVTFNDNVASTTNIGVVSGGTVEVVTGKRIVAGGDDTALNINGNGITLNAGGGAGNETVTNTGSGTITIIDTATTSLANNSISIDTGTLTIDSAIIAAPGNSVEIYTNGDVSLTGAQIGGTSANEPLEIDFAGTPSGTNTLTVNTDGDGDVGLDINEDLFDVVNITANVTTATYEISIDWAADTIDMTTNTTALTINNIDTSAFDTDVSVTQSAGNVVVTSVNTDGGDFALTASSGSIAVDTISTAATADVTLSSSAGITSIDADDDTADITTGDFIVSNATGVGVSGSALDIDATTSNITASGNVFFDVVGADGHATTVDVSVGNIVIYGRNTANDGGYEAITLTNVDTDNGAVTVNNYDYDLTATSVASGGNNNIQLTTTSSGDILLGSVVADGTGDVTIQAVAGSINETGTGDAGVDISGDALTLTAQDEIGGAGELDIEISATSLDASSTTAGNIVITESDGITLTDVDTANGAITINTGGATVVTDVAASGSGDEDDVTIIASTGSITLGTVSAAGEGDVTIQATDGSINDAAADSLVDIVADFLTLTATGEIGGTLALETTVESLDASSTTAGNIVITETGGITLSDVDTVNGAITINTGGSTVVTDVAASGGGDEDDVTIVASAGDITIGAVSAAGSGDVGIQATAGSINETNTGDSAVDISGDALILSALDEIGGTGELDVETTVTSLNAFSTNGNIVLTETDNLALGNIQAPNGNIVLEATTGAMTQSAGTVTTAIGGSLSMKSNGDLDMANYIVDNRNSTNLILDSTGGSAIVTGSAADDWLSITAAAQYYVTLSGDGDITTGDLETRFAGATGVQIFTDTGSGGSLDAQGTITSGGFVDVDVEGSASFADTVTAGGNIELEAGIDLQINDDLTATGGGVSLISETGKIYTPGGSNDTLNVAISGYSAPGVGVELPGPGAGVAAISIISAGDLILGDSAKLNAGGIYNPGTPTIDDRLDVGFDPSLIGGADPIDVAIYLRSYRPDALLKPIGTITAGSEVTIADNGTMVIDAGEKVIFNGDFYKSVFNTSTRLEVVSRRSETLGEVITYDRLPHADDPESIRNFFNESTGYFAGAYVLRGVKTLLAEVLALTNPVPLVPPRTLEPEFRSEVEGPDTEALANLLSELGIGVQPFVTEAYAELLSTDLRLYKAAEKLQGLMPILEEKDGTRIAGLRKAVAQYFPTLDSLSDEQMESFTQILENHKGDGTDYDLAGQCIFALREYVNILSTEIGWPVEKSVEFVMGRYVPRITENDEIRIAVIQMHLQK